MKPIPGAQQNLYLLSPTWSFPIHTCIIWGSSGHCRRKLYVRLRLHGKPVVPSVDPGSLNRPVVVPGIPTTSATINKRVPDQRYGAINIVESNSIDYYDAAQASVEKRLTRGLTLPRRLYLQQGHQSGR